MGLDPEPPRVDPDRPPSPYASLGAVELDDLLRDLDGLTPESLAASTEPVDVPGWPPPGRSFPVSECLLTVLNEEWHHRLFAERDLDALEAR